MTMCYDDAVTKCKHFTLITAFPNNAVVAGKGGGGGGKMVTTLNHNVMTV